MLLHCSTPISGPNANKAGGPLKLPEPNKSELVQGCLQCAAERSDLSNGWTSSFRSPRFLGSKEPIGSST